MGKVELEKMSSGGKGATATSSRASIPGSVKKTIENIKEITGQSHGDDEIHAMLKECSMDPNETAQRLLLLGLVFSLYTHYLLYFSLI